jgi:hypothetical protein
MSRWLISLALVLLAIPSYAQVKIGGGQPAETDPPKKSNDLPAIVLKRKSELSDDELRKQLTFVKEIGLDQSAAAALYTPIKEAGSDVKSLPPDLGPKFFGQMVASMKKSEEFGLPWRAGPDCEMGKEAAERLHVLSTRLRVYLRKAVPQGDVRPDPDKLRDLLAHGEAGFGVRPIGKKKPARVSTEEWTKPEAIPTLMQMLQAENAPIRDLLVELLGDIKGKEASIALAQRAIFDLSPTVREHAVRQLAKRPPQEYQKLLLVGLRYPWTAAADHSAEAIAALRLTDLARDMVEMLKEPDPTFPIKDGKTFFVRELVRINHLSNCMVCHAPSLAKDDLIRGRVPMPGEDPPPLYYAEQSGLFVRADITYLRQDFSVVQPVANAGKWPGNQRYDYVLRIRQATRQEIKVYEALQKEKKLPKNYAQRESVLFALRQVARIDAGDSYDDWIRELPKALKGTRPPDEGR